MNDLGVRDRDHVIDRDRQDNPAVDREIKSPAKHRPPVRRRWGGRLFALGGFLLLAGGLSLGVWGQYSQQEQVTATAVKDSQVVEQNLLPSTILLTTRPIRHGP